MPLVMKFSHKMVIELGIQAEFTLDLNRLWRIRNFPTALSPDCLDPNNLSG